MAEKSEVFTDCTLCYHSCGAKVTIEDGKATKIRGLDSHPINKGRLCPKGANALEVIYSPDRLKQPLKRINGRFEVISWDRALDEIAEKLSRLKAAYGPQILGFFCGSIGVENLEMSTLVHLLRSGFGSPNFFSVESICYRMRIRTRQMTFGRYPTEEPESNLYILWGHNPDQSDFPLKFFLARNLKKGARLVVIDPKRIPLADRADMYLRIRPGTDGALALAMMNVIIEEDLYDHDFVEKHTSGFDKLMPHVRKHTPEWAQEITWIAADDIRQLARLFAGTKGAGIFQGTCTQDQTANGTQNSRAFSVLQAITGNINVPGGWVTSPAPRFGNPGFSLGGGDPLGSDRYPLFFDLWGRKSPMRCGNAGARKHPRKAEGLSGSRRQSPRFHAGQQCLPGGFCQIGAPGGTRSFHDGNRKSGPLCPAGLLASGEMGRGLHIQCLPLHPLSDAAEKVHRTAERKLVGVEISDRIGEADGRRR
jgi:anaerobic selenocysteine-containing dehydrogenase